MTSSTLGVCDMLARDVRAADLNVNDEEPLVCLCTIYHTLRGGVLRSVLDSKNTLGASDTFRVVVSETDLSLRDDDLPPICVCMLYHSMGRGSLEEALKSVDSLDYPKERLMLVMIDNYSRDGAFDYVKNWLEARKERYMGVIHIRAKGSVPRLRNIGMLVALGEGSDTSPLLSRMSLLTQSSLKGFWLQ